jgi:hypothetical protein
MKAMSLWPEDRYTSPRLLAADIERWLADEPVSAWREPWHVRMGRWARRHQTLVTSVTAGFLVALIAVGSGAFWLDHKRTESRRRYDTTMEKVKELEQLGRPGEAREVLKAALKEGTGPGSDSIGLTVVEKIESDRNWNQLK